MITLDVITLGGFHCIGFVAEIAGKLWDKYSLMDEVKWTIGKVIFAAKS